MQFIFHKNSGEENIFLENKDFHYIFNVRRESKDIGAIFKFANLKDNTIYQYKLINLFKNKASFSLLDSTKNTQIPIKTHIIQAIIDNNEFEKILPILNELFVEKISLFYADFSQRKYKINIERLQNILINSSMQCGRISLMKIEIFNNLDSILENYSNIIALDFNAKLKNIDSINSFIIGPEGGFSKREKELLKECSCSINHPLIMRSHTASIFIASHKIKFN
ncbi:RsmE family RNA methyltransferase [Helicobacter sp. MIT 14-3879]|uniref:16S rRNA (uracil(1498)-N(3))-methyltransferase n=1 Tax=Helicobacter sp. MIT 14-3879 TaxID=2040649 RepID=UPI000E1E8B09|nr:RsmE family RNA methyltransferase [Helicobacter sp. MIT 14-3879]RDU64667.1 16S rRNA (uracil(1498)-N(3))-methyltransferase [Helicobacter sp. MIT 14-3879]